MTARRPGRARLIGTLVLAAIALTVGVHGVAAQAPQPVTIALHSRLGCPCTFEAAGAINDSGSVVVDSVIAAAIPSPIVGTGHYVRTFFGGAGSFTIRLETVLT